MYPITKRAIKADTFGSIAVEGVFDVPKDPIGAIAFTVGQKVYVDGSNEPQTTATGNKLLGKAVLPAAADADNVRVRLSQYLKECSPLALLGTRWSQRYRATLGHANELRALLSHLGYLSHGRGYRHADRKVVFVGDFVDRGPSIGEVVKIAREMVDAGDALAVMGNHEYNAIAFHTPRPRKHDEWFRPHSEKNLKQHQATLDQFSPGELADAIAWFKTLPVAIEIGGIRVAHASRQTRDIDCINDALVDAGRFTPDFLAMSEDSGSDLNNAIENVLKGPELQMPDGHSIVDKAGHQRDSVRIKWYEDGTGRTYRQHHLGSDEVPDVEIATGDLDTVDIYPRDAVPVFVGHYWLTGTPKPLAANVACTDYSVAKAGKLVAYRWNGEATLSTEAFYRMEANSVKFVTLSMNLRLW